MTKERSELKGIGYEIFIGILSILSIVNLVLLYAVQERSLDTVLTVMNALFSVIFVVDFLYRIVTAPSAGAYFLSTSAGPTCWPVCLWRSSRSCGSSGWSGYTACSAMSATARSAVLCSKIGPAAPCTHCCSWAFSCWNSGASRSSASSRAPGGPSYATASDAIWYTIVTISTVGYGDQYPVTDAGRMMGTGIIIVGVGIFGTFTGYLANFFLSPKKREPAPPVDAVETSTATIEGLRLRLEESEAKLTEIRKLLVEPT